jgi:hypothetical protein
MGVLANKRLEPIPAQPSRLSLKTIRIVVASICLTESPRRRHQLIIVPLPNLTLARFQLAKNFQQLAAQRYFHTQFLAFFDDVGERDVDFGADLLLDVAQGPLRSPGF